MMRVASDSFHPGRRLGPYVTPPVTKIQLVKYSGASGDFNPIHTVEEFAVQAGLGGVIAHGMLTMAFVGEMLTQTIGEDGDLLTFSIRFTDMVRPGDVVTCEGEVTDAQDDGSGKRVTCKVWATTQPGKTVVQGRATFRVPSGFHSV
jgi:acyl dehydratase